MMQILHLFRFERLRDGGSLSVSFQADDGCEYWLLFPITSREGDTRAFGEPVLVNRTTGVEVDLLHAGARQWLRRLEPHVQRRPALAHGSRDEEDAIRREMWALCEPNQETARPSME